MKQTYLAQFKHVPVGALFTCNETRYNKINGRMGQINMPDKPYHGNKFYFGYSELCSVIEGITMKQKWATDRQIAADRKEMQRALQNARIDKSVMGRNE